MWIASWVVTKRLQQLTLNLNSASSPSCSKQHDPTESVDCAPGGAHPTARACIQFQNQLTPELSPDFHFPVVVSVSAWPDRSEDGMRIFVQTFPQLCPRFARNTPGVSR